jgi:hypothetical protein
MKNNAVASSQADRFSMFAILFRFRFQIQIGPFDIKSVVTTRPKNGEKTGWNRPFRGVPGFPRLKLPSQ